MMSVSEFFAYLYSPKGQSDLIEKIKEAGREECATNKERLQKK